MRARLAELEAATATLTLAKTATADHERIQHALMASEVRYRRLFETAKDGILILDADTGMIADANRFLLNLLGYSSEEKLWAYTLAGIVLVLFTVYQVYLFFRSGSVFQLFLTVVDVVILLLP